MIEPPRTKREKKTLLTKEAFFCLRVAQNKSEAFMWIVQFTIFPVNYSLLGGKSEFHVVIACSF